MGIEENDNGQGNGSMVNWGTDTKLLVEQKSEELQLSQNRLTEICLQRYLPEMQWN